MTTPATRPPLMSLDDARAALLSTARPIGDVETVSSFAADGRVLAETLVAEIEVPPADNSAMDGYAVRAIDAATDGWLPVSQRIAAGAAAAPLAPGSAARIFTGAQVPAGADAIVMQEDCELDSSDVHGPRVRIRRAPVAGQWIRRQGEDVRRGSTVLARGTVLSPASIGLSAGVGRASLTVARKPRVALFSTGDELVMPGTVAPAAMPPGAIYNSNRFFLKTLLERLGCEVRDEGIVPDRLDATVEAFRRVADTVDLLLTSGGVSVGEEDHVKPAVQALGSLDLWQIAIKPGKPFAHGRVGGAHFIGLPGNPVSSFVTFLVLVRPFLRALQGAATVLPAAIPTVAAFDWPRADKRREFLRVRRNAGGELELFDNQSSGVLTSVAWADGLVDNPPGRVIRRGERVAYLPLTDLLS